MNGLTRPLFVIPLRRLDRVAHKALRFTLGLSGEIYVVQVLAEELETEDLAPCWRDLIVEPLQRAGRTPPMLVVLRSPYREFYGPFLRWIGQLATTHRDRHIVVVVPELVYRRRWYHVFLNRHETWLKTRLLLDGGPHVVVMNTPWYPDVDPAQHPGPIEGHSRES